MIHDVTSERNHKLRRLSGSVARLVVQISFGKNLLLQMKRSSRWVLCVCVCIRGRASVFLAGKLTHSG